MWVEVFTTTFPLSEIIKGRLESEDIPVFLKYEALSKICGITQNGLGEIKILVPEEFVEIAKQIIHEIDYGC